ncbi:MAG: hypothetical protein Q7R76_00980 [Candidatus Woesearchaeota archaeon]|nr:hypothetical protein [Candidatus Woesearchaeota archaeon]
MTENGQNGNETSGKAPLEGLVNADAFLYDAVNRNGHHIAQASLRKAYAAITAQPGGITPTMVDDQPFFTGEDLERLKREYDLRPSSALRKPDALRGYTQLGISHEGNYRTNAATPL